MAKDMRTFIEDVKKELPGELIHITKEVNPANFDCTAIIKKMDALKKFPVTIFDRPLNLKGKVNEDVKLILNAEISQGKIQVALGVPKDYDRVRLLGIKKGGFKYGCLYLNGVSGLS